MANAEFNFTLRAMLGGHRLDGRTLSEFRVIRFHFPQTGDLGNNGCCIVSIGSTSVMARISTEVVEPKPSRPSQGTLFVNFDASVLNMSLHSQDKSHRNEEGRKLSAVLQNLLRDAVDLDALCIVAWESVFAIRVELRALSYDGNLADCGALAAVAALASFYRPDVFVQENGKVIVDFEAKYRPRVPLEIRRIPVLVTFGLTTEVSVVIQDPSAREESVLTGGRVMIGVTNFSEICCVHTSNLSGPIHSTSIVSCVRLARTRGKHLISLLNKALESLKSQRKTGQSHAALPSDAVGFDYRNSTQPPVLFMSSALTGTCFVPEDDDDEASAALRASPPDSDTLIKEKFLAHEENPIPIQDALNPNPSLPYEPYGVIEIPCVNTPVSDVR